MKRITAVLLCLCMLLSLCACSGKDAKEAELVIEETPAPVEETQNEEPAEPEEGPESVRRQLELIGANRSQWESAGQSEQTYCAVTDLDGNGRLEIFTACTQGSGLFTYGKLFEVSSGFDTLNECLFNISEGESIPEVTLSATDKYSDPETGLNYYVFYDTTKDGAAYSLVTTDTLCLKSGNVLIDHIASGESTPGSLVLRDCASGREINTVQYNTAVADRYFGAVRSTAYFGWFVNSGSELSADLENSYKVFIGETEAPAAPFHVPELAPMPDPEPAAYPELPAAGSAGNINITKSPTSESLAVGGKTWFIAGATNAGEPMWHFIDPNNRVYSVEETMAANPGLVLQVLDKGTIAVDKVPQSLNGWSVQAVFANDTYSAATNPAAIYVGDYVNAYGSVIGSYKRAYEAGRVTEQSAATYGISEMAGYSDHVGYAMKDLNKDGVPELIVAATGTGNNAENIIYEIDTISNGTIICLCKSTARDRYYLRTDSIVYNRGSSGAAYATYRLLKLTTPKALASIQEVRSDLDNNARAVWYYTDANGTQTISETAAYKYVDDWESIIYTPIMTKIA